MITEMIDNNDDDKTKVKNIPLKHSELMNIFFEEIEILNINNFLSV
jgi:hypothetical protein